MSDTYETECGDDYQDGLDEDVDAPPHYDDEGGVEPEEEEVPVVTAVRPFVIPIHNALTTTTTTSRVLTKSKVSGNITDSGLYNMADLKAAHLPMVPSFTCLLVRGLPGSGKDRFANAYGRRFVQSQPPVAASFELLDTRHPGSGGDVGKEAVRQHHLAVQQNAEDVMSRKGTARVGLVCIVSTFCKIWEMESYIKTAVANGYHMAICGLFDAGGASSEFLSKRSSSHTPPFVIESMRSRYRKIPSHYMGLLDDKQVQELLLLDSTIVKTPKQKLR